MKNALLLVSGGLDSVVTAYYVKNRMNYKNLVFLFFDYGQRACKQEENCSRKIAVILKAKFLKVRLNWLKELSGGFLTKDKTFPKTRDRDLANGKKDILDWWVPCRNAIFVIVALAHAESLYLKKKKRYDIFLGLKYEGKVHMKDTTPEFIRKMQEAAEEATHHGGYRIIAPLIKMDKPKVVKIGEELGVPFELTYSCYTGNKNLVHCGECLNCMLRKKGFYWAGIDDRTKYAVLRTKKRFINQA